MQTDLKGKVALVTGAAHRVGKAIALELARHGVHIVVNYRSAPEAVVAETISEINGYGVEALPVQADVGTPDGVASLFKQIEDTVGALHILVNSASIFPAGTVDQTSHADWQRALDVNLTGPFLCTQAAVALMRRNEPAEGVIVNICDVGTLRPWPERASHGVSKSALWMLTQTSAVTYAADRIRVNAIMPGPVLPPPGMPDSRWQKIGQDQTLLGHPGEPEDVARAVAYLCREDFLTGVLLPVNGGEHLKW
jgi:NAD(P)-dependent dehydrogenase (short-subunit alcohol dehydrogenase family)